MQIFVYWRKKRPCIAGYLGFRLRTRMFVCGKRWEMTVYGRSPSSALENAKLCTVYLSLSLCVSSLFPSLFRASLVYPSSPAPQLDFCFVFLILLVGFWERSCWREGFFSLSKWWQVRWQRRHIWQHGLHRKRWWRGAPHAPAPAPRMRRRSCLLRRLSIIRGSRDY